MNSDRNKLIAHLERELQEIDYYAFYYISAEQIADVVLEYFTGEGIASESRSGETAIEVGPEGPAPAKDSHQVPDAPSPVRKEDE